MEKYDQGITDLLEAFKVAGIPRSRSWIYRQEKRGVLDLPKSTTNFKYIKSIDKRAPVRVMTRSQIKSVVRSFLPGGKGSWIFEEES